MLLPCNLQPKARYSLNWAKSIVLKAYQERPRAWDFLKRFYGVTGKVCVVLLAIGAKEWHEISKMAKLVDKMLHRPKDPPEGVQGVDKTHRIYSTCVEVDHIIHDDRLKNPCAAYLTAAFFDPMLEEQGKSEKTASWRPSQGADDSPAARSAKAWLHR